MKVAIIGTGYVGLPTGVGLAEFGHTVVCIDKEKSKIDALKAGQITLYEAGLEELFHKNVEAGRLSFSMDMQEAVSQADVVIIGVGTPFHPVAQKADMKYLHAAATELAAYLQGYTVVAVKSTVLVGVGDDVEIIMKMKNPKAAFDVVSLPEFLREGYAVHDFFNPDRVVAGVNSERAKAAVLELYKPIADKTTMLFVSRCSAETIKYASNSFLAMKIHYINEMANFCEKTGADIEEVAKGMGLDKRIGAKFLHAGPGYGGSCFPKDTQAMLYMAKRNNVEMSLVSAVIEGNEKRKIHMAERILAAVEGIEKPKIAVWGLAFKNGTDDCRESPAVGIIAELLKHDAEIIAYDSKAEKSAYSYLGDKITYAKSMYEAVQDADVLAILTEWEEFKLADADKLGSLMRNKKIVDCRNLLDKENMLAHGFDYYGIGQGIGRV